MAETDGSAIAGFFEASAVRRIGPRTKPLVARAYRLDTAGCRHAIDEAARSFYLKFGFVRSPIDDLTLMLDLGKLVQLLRRQVHEPA